MFCEKYIIPDAQAREEDGKRPSQDVLDKMAYVFASFHCPPTDGIHREVNLHAMRMGPGKHLKGLTLMNGLVKPEEYDYFHEACTPSTGIQDY